MAKSINRKTLGARSVREGVQPSLVLRPTVVVQTTQVAPVKHARISSKPVKVPHAKAKAAPPEEY